jgi:hypothetical protein
MEIIELKESVDEFMDQENKFLKDRGLIQHNSIVNRLIIQFIIKYSLGRLSKTRNNMKVKVPGHTYELANFENKEGQGQTLQFIHKEPKEEGSIELITISDGTTNEEVLECLINRMQFLQSKFPCRENAIVITNLEESLMWLNKRTADRVKRDVEGKQLA